MAIGLAIWEIKTKERARLDALQVKIGQRETLQHAQQLAANHEAWQARALLEDLLADPDLEPDVRAAAQKLQAQLQ